MLANAGGKQHKPETELSMIRNLENSIMATAVLIEQPATVIDPLELHHAPNVKLADVAGGETLSIAQ